MTFAKLRALHALIGQALDDIENIYATQSGPSGASPPNNGGGEHSRETHFDTSPLSIGKEIDVKAGDKPKNSSSNKYYASPPPSPSVFTNSHSIPPASKSTYATSSGPSLLDFPSLDAPCDPTSLSEGLTAHPTVLAAINRIVAATGQISATVQAPFLTICDATMGYHLPSCMRLLEASHVVEILREAGPDGLHVDAISQRNGVDSVKLAHILRLLATHHILRELSPNLFSLNRISSLIDSGKSFSDLEQFQTEGRPESKYKDSNGIAAFVGLCTDEIQKASAYMTETYYLSPSKSTREGREPTKAPFCFAFDTLQSKTGYFGWLEGESDLIQSAQDAKHEVETGQGRLFPPVRERAQSTSIIDNTSLRCSTPGDLSSRSSSSTDLSIPRTRAPVNANRFRLERFGKAMAGTESWETPGAILNSFDWQSLPHGSTVVDVGGGIGSTSMLLATVFASADKGSSALSFVIQDRPPVVEMGEKAWRDQCPGLLNTSVQFQVHDFFEPQPVRHAAVFILRVVLHDWPDDYARKILLQLRAAATTKTKLLIGDFVLPLACHDDIASDADLRDIEGAEGVLAPAPLLPNLGKASANAYWMDLTMQTMFNSQERTLRELVALSASAGWKITKLVTCPNSLLGYLTAEPVDVPTTHCVDYFKLRAPKEPVQGRPSQLPQANKKLKERHRIERASSRCGTPTFGSKTKLSFMEEAFAKFGGGVLRSRRSRAESNASRPLPPLKPAVTLTPTSVTKKPRPAPLSIIPLPSLVQTSPTPAPSPSTNDLTLPLEIPQKTAGVPRLIKKCVSLAQLRLGHSTQPSVGSHNEVPPIPPRSPARSRGMPSSFSPNTAPLTPLRRRTSQAQPSFSGNASDGSIIPFSSTSGDSFIPLPLLPMASGQVPTTPPQKNKGHIRQPSLGPPVSNQRSSGPLSSFRRGSLTTGLPSLPLRKRSGSAVQPSVSGFEPGGVPRTVLNLGYDINKEMPQVETGDDELGDLLEQCGLPRPGAAVYARGTDFSS